MPLLAFVLGLTKRCFLHMPDDTGRDCWDWVGPPTFFERACFNSQSGVEAPRLLKQCLSRLDYCCIVVVFLWLLCGCCVVVVVWLLLWLCGCCGVGRGLSDVYIHTTLKCNVSETQIYMWHNAWESDSRRSRHTRSPRCHHPQSPRQPTTVGHRG